MHATSPPQTMSPRSSLLLREGCRPSPLKPNPMSHKLDMEDDEPEHSPRNTPSYLRATETHKIR